MPEIGDQPVGHVDHRVSDAAEARADIAARLRKPKASNEPIAMLGCEVRVLATQDLEAEKGITDRATDPDMVARLCALAANFLTSSHMADRGQGQRWRALGRGRIAAEQRQAVAMLV